MVIRSGTHTDERGNLINNNSPDQVECKLIFRSENCSLTIGEGCNLRGSLFIFNAPNSRVIIGDHVKMITTYELGLGSSIVIGNRTTNTRHTYISAAEGADVTIGEDCMFASDNEVRSDDSHPIFDLESGSRVNPSRSIAVGNHVWIAKRAVILSGSCIGDESVIGFGAIVKGNIPNNVVASGNPARILKSGITWRRNHVSKHAPFMFPDITATSNK